MAELQVHDILTDKILVSRESAHLLEGPLKTLLATGSQQGFTQPAIDFAGVEGLSPSFLDELLSIFDALLGEKAANGTQSLMVINPPTRLSSKFEAVARGHNMSADALPSGAWLLKRK